jgi:hypothetical protein
MYSLPSKPEPIGVVLDDAVELYRQAFRACLPTTLVGTVLITALRLKSASPFDGIKITGQGAQQLFAEIGRAAQQMNTGSSGSLLNSLLVILLEVLIYGALFAQIHNVALHGRALTALDALIIGLRRLPGMALAALIWTVAVFFGMFLLLVPGVFLWGKLEFWIAAAFVDDVGSIGGLGRSWEVTNGNWWRSVTALSVALIVVAVLGIGADMLAAVALAFTRDLTTVLLVTQVLQGIGAIFVLPMLPAAMLAIYYDMKLRRDGEDLLNRVKSLQTA